MATRVGFSIPHSLSFLEGFSYTKNNSYLGVIMGVCGVFHHQTQLIDALIASYGVLLRAQLAEHSHDLRILLQVLYSCRREVTHDEH